MLVTTVAELQTAPYIICKPREDVDRFVTISQCENKRFCETRENTALIAILLQIRHCSFGSDDKKALLTTGSRYVPGSSVGTRQKIGGGNRMYDRLALFADTKENGRCFAIIFKNASMSSTFFENCIRTHEGVGNVLFLDEPTPVVSTLGSTASVPIIDSVWTAIPISNPMNTLIPHVPMIAPDMGCTRYFCSHNVRDIKFCNPRFVESICHGYFCDRQLCPDNLMMPNNARCGCFQTDRSSPATMIQFDIALTCPPEFDQSETTYVINFRSYRTSMLFIKEEALKFVKKSNSNHLTLLRQAVRNIVEYVNRNGGWSYIGWMRTGIVHDVSETQSSIAENLASTSQSPHLSYLYPTNALQFSNQNDEFNIKKMILVATENDELVPHNN